MSNYQINIVRAIRTSEVSSAFLVLFSSILLPFLIHLVPSIENVPLGARLLPMYYIPIVALSLFRLRTVLFPTMLAPLVNYLVTGSPQWQIVLMFSYEIGIFTIILHKINRVDMSKVAVFNGSISYIATKIVSMGILSIFPLLLQNSTPKSFFYQSLSLAWPGVIILIFIKMLSIKMKKDKW